MAKKTKRKVRHACWAIEITKPDSGAQRYAAEFPGAGPKTFLTREDAWAWLEYRGPSAREGAKRQRWRPVHVDLIGR